jgi:hypothetical protein
MRLAPEPPHADDNGLPARAGKPVGTLWMWTLTFGYYEDRYMSVPSASALGDMLDILGEKCHGAHRKGSALSWYPPAPNAPARTVVARR